MLDGVPARIWEGKTKSGIPIHCYITRLAVREGLPDNVYKEFENQLVEQSAPSVEVEALPLRLIL